MRKTPKPAKPEIIREKQKAWKKNPGKKPEGRYNLRKPADLMNDEQRAVAASVGMGPRAALLLAEHPVHSRCNEPWDIIDRRLLRCSRCNFTLQIADDMDPETKG